MCERCVCPAPVCFVVVGALRGQCEKYRFSHTSISVRYVQQRSENVPETDMLERTLQSWCVPGSCESSLQVSLSKSLTYAVKTHDRDDNHESRRECAPWSFENIALCLKEHSAPAWLRGLNSKTQVAHAGFCKYGI